uniref:Uncharacterized protein n=1 Tax=Anopheles epiroticus TaxID=199890 RepID=A0A182PNJ5_9DIPT
MLITCLEEEQNGRLVVVDVHKAPSEATFRGTEFLSYDLGQTGGEPIVSAQDAITLYFRTRQPNGLLFYTACPQTCESFPEFVTQ